MEHIYQGKEDESVEDVGNAVIMNNNIGVSATLVLMGKEFLSLLSC